MLLVGGSTVVLVILYGIILAIQLIYFSVPGRYVSMSLLDYAVVLIFNLFCLAIVIFDIPTAYDSNKPKSPFIGIGQSLDEYIWSVYYDYKSIVPKKERKNYV